MEIVDVVPPMLKDNVIVTSVDALFKWGKANSIWPLSSGLACCSIEMMCAAASRFDLARFGYEVFRSCPRQSDLLIVAGTLTWKMTPPLIRLYEEALAYPGVEGLIVGTRPDCMPDALLDYFETLSRRRFVLIEYGLESTLDRTLERINRGHTEAESETAIRRTAERGIYTGAHLILGLPGESRSDLLHHAEVIGNLPLTTLKLHQLQLIRHTRMAKEYETAPEDFHFFTVDEYIDLVIDFIERLPQRIVLERFVSQSPKSLLIKPDWGLKNYEFTAKVHRRLAERDTYQGRLFANPAPTLCGEG